VNKALNVLSFAIGWGVCLWAATQNYSWLIPWLGGVGIVAINVSVQKKRRLALAKVFTVVVLGFFFEWMNQHIGFYAFNDHHSIFPPLWLLSFWPVFSLLFIEFFDRYANEPLWVHLLFGSSAALGYYCGEWFQLITFQRPIEIYLALFCLVWAFQYFFIVKAVQFVRRRPILWGS
jgi:Protein of unknown function (DUF2878)